MGWSCLDARSVAKYITIALASGSVMPRFGILVSGFILWGYLIQR